MGSVQKKRHSIVGILLFAFFSLVVILFVFFLSLQTLAENDESSSTIVESSPLHVVHLNDGSLIKQAKGGNPPPGKGKPPANNDTNTTQPPGQNDTNTTQPPGTNDTNTTQPPGDNTTEPPAPSEPPLDFSGVSFSIPTLDDEKNAYASFGWTWDIGAEPNFASDSSYAVSDPDVHEDTEGDDLWTYLMMYYRSGEEGYVDRARAWENYFVNDYATCSGLSYSTLCFDRDGYGGDHVYGWGLVDWYRVTKDTEALAAAETIAGVVEGLYDETSEFGCLAVNGCMHYGVRQIGRHLQLVTRVAQITGDSRWISLRNELLDKIMNAPEWNDTYGTYFFGEWTTDTQYLQAGAYASGARLQSSLEIGIFMEALWEAYQATGREDIKQRLIAMAYFVDQYGLDPRYQYAGSVFGIVDGQVWHDYAAENPVKFWDPAYTTTLVDSLVVGYKLTGNVSLYDKAKYVFERGNKGIYGEPRKRKAADGVVDHFVDTTLDASTDGFYLYGRGELQYTYLLFENGGNPTVLDVQQTPPPGPPPEDNSSQNDTGTGQNDTSTGQNDTSTGDSSSGTGSSGSSTSTGGGGGGLSTESFSVYRKLPLERTIYAFPLVDPKGAGSLVVDPTLDVGIKSIFVKVKQLVQNVNIEVVRFSGKPDIINTSQFGKVYQYLEIDGSDFGENLDTAVVTMSVDKSWIDETGLDKDDISVFRSDLGKDVWNELETELVDQDDTHYYYATELHSFSYFVVSEKIKKEELLGSAEFSSSANALQKAQAKDPIPFWIFIALVVIMILLAVIMAARNRK